MNQIEVQQYTKVSYSHHGKKVTLGLRARIGLWQPPRRNGVGSRLNIVSVLIPGFFPGVHFLNDW